MTGKAIETRYSGYRFRSRLEARWAVFFDAMRLRYDYEPEGYDLGEAGWYLPDFWLKDLKMWLEVKGRESQGDELAKCQALFQSTGHAVFFAIGEPHYGQLWLYCNDATSSSGGEGWWEAEWIESFSFDRPCVSAEVFRGDRSLLNGKWEALQSVREDYEPAIDCIRVAGDKARQARFEHGENGHGL